MKTAYFGLIGLAPLVPLLTCSVPNRPVRPALGTAGLAQAVSEMAGPDCGKPTFQNKNRVRPGDLQALGVSTITLMSRKPLQQIKVRVDSRDFRCFNLL